MGVPKFFRYISERYPCLSEIVREYQLPEFDNLYLDMNGIIHVCSHPNDTDPHFRITEEKIFRDIFHYIETLFRMIQPQKLFFMAVDGVAPRAKMNQQRGRRFRSAKDAEVAEANAKERGEVLPSEDRFDSNCITPGTEFMTRLQAQLKYFVTFKISTDKLWQKVKVILSGHETPGEGEHKIMDYIRYMKSQPGYNPNTRHCLYGLDADLIMLGLCTHEPHFSLLREEVKYGKKNNQKRIPTPEETTFYLLHLSLMREYIDLEFQQLKMILPFTYNLENIIDDWVLMGFLVGNDFIPHLPDLHINKGALPILYRTYMDVLPTLGGYINEGGTLRLDRFQKYMEKLAAFDFEQFKETSTDLRYFESKTGLRLGGKERPSYKTVQNDTFPSKNKDLEALIASTEEVIEGLEDDDDNSLESDEEVEDGTSFAEFCAHKKNYYMEKLEYDKVTPEVLRSQGEGYVRAIQWNLNYYYNGCCSWSWFYPHHYAPYISDIKNFSNLLLEYDMGQPFLPFQQLLAVLPAASKNLLPEAYHELMENDASPIIQFYPAEFKTDLNGKKQDWEAVVLIPFIEQDKLVRAMETKENQLTEEEKSRNKHGPMQIYTYTSENLGSYVAPAYFPALANHHAKVENLNREDLFVEKNKLVKGLCPEVKLDVYFLGFPTLRHIPFSATLMKAKVKVFESSSTGDNMILTITSQGHPNVSEVATQLLGKSIFVNWPHLFEARVVAVSSEKIRLTLSDENTSIVEEGLNKTLQAQWNLTKQSIEDRYIMQKGINVGKTEILVYACTMVDKKLLVTDDKVHFEKQWSQYPIAYPLQTTRTNIAVHESTQELNLTVEQIFKPDTTVFGLNPSYYGTMGTILDCKNQRLRVNFKVHSEPNLEQMVGQLRKMAPIYKSANVLAQRLHITSNLLSRITGTIYILSEAIQETEHKPFKLNIGLNLKFNKKNEEVCGYTRRDISNGYWMYSEKAEEEVRQYMHMFPEVFSYLTKNTASEDIHAKDLYPDNTESKLAELGNWLKERNSTKTERQVCGAQILEEEIVLELEKEIDHFLKNELSIKLVTINCKPTSLYVPKSKLGYLPESNGVHKLFDRITNIRESHTVPLGARGTIIGIHDAEKGPQAMYDVLFDKEFPGGLRLRSSPHRGYRLSGQGFLNLTHGQTCEINRGPGKPTAVVEPSGIEEEEVSVLNNNGHNSAFASWRNKPNTNLGNSPLHFGVELHGNKQSRDSDQPLRSRHQTGKNKAGQNTKCQSNIKGSGQPLADPSNALKKVLKIADDANKKQPSADNQALLRSSNSHSYCMQLLSLHQSLGIKLPRYLYTDTKDGAIICTVVCADGKEFRGSPAYGNDPAAESAAYVALQYLPHDDTQKNFMPSAAVTAPLYPPKRSTLIMNSPQRPAFTSTKRLPMGPNQGWMREPAKPSTLPQPPTNWYQNPGVSSFQPEWRSSGVGRAANPNFFSTASQYQHDQRVQHNQFGQFNSHRQQNQIPPWQQRTPFIPLQAETRIRQQSQPYDRYREPFKNSTPPKLVEQPSARMPPPSENRSGRNSTRLPRSRIAANFSQPFKFGAPDSSQ